MPATSSLQQQALDIGQAVLQGGINGQPSAQNLKIQTEALASAVMMLATALNTIATSTTAIGANLSATIGTTLTPGGTGFAATSTFVPPNYVGTSADPVTFASVLSGSTPVAPQSP
jgi:hypothetical protein